MRIKCKCGEVILTSADLCPAFMCECGEKHTAFEYKGRGIIWMHYTESEVVEDNKIEPMITSESYCLFDKINEIINYINERDAE